MTGQFQVKGKALTRLGAFMRSQKEGRKSWERLVKYYTFSIILSSDPHNTLESRSVEDYVPILKIRNGNQLKL